MVFIENLNIGVHRKGHWLILSLSLIEFSLLLFLLLLVLFLCRYWFIFYLFLFVCLLDFCCRFCCCCCCGWVFFSLTSHEFSVKASESLIKMEERGLVYRLVTWS